MSARCITEKDVGSECVCSWSLEKLAGALGTPIEEWMCEDMREFWEPYIRNYQAKDSGPVTGNLRLQTEEDGLVEFVATPAAVLSAIRAGHKHCIRTLLPLVSYYDSSKLSYVSSMLENLSDLFCGSEMESLRREVCESESDMDVDDE